MIRKMIGNGSCRGNIQSQTQRMHKWFRRRFHMPHIEGRRARILAFTGANELLQQRRFSNTPWTKNMQDKKRQMFGTYGRGEKVQLAFTPHKTRMTCLLQMFSQAGRHAPSRMDST